MKEHKFSTGFRNSYKRLKSDILTIIYIMLKDVDKIQLEDNKGSLCVNVIDDQMSEVIQSLEVITRDNRKRPRHGRLDKVVAWIGVHENDYSQSIDEYEVPMLLNILEAIEKAID